MKKSIVLILVFFSLNVFSLEIDAKTFKCWTNTEGIKECGNSLPPEYVKQRIEFFNEKSGRVSEVSTAAKTDAQILAEKEQLKQQEKREREEKKKKSYDDVLLKTYLSVDDLLLSLQWKITTLNSAINVTEGEITTENNKFLSYASQAAQKERSGAKIDKSLSDDLQNSRKKTKRLEQRIASLEQDKTDINAKFSNDIDRFVVARISGLTLTLRDDEKARSLDMIQVNCKNLSKCSEMWLSAKAFVKAYSDLEIKFNTDSVYTTASPQKPTLLAYTISKIQSHFNNTITEKITLQIRCNPSRIGEELCKSQQVTDQLNAFKKRMEEVHEQVN